MREILRRKLVATSLCAGPHRIAWAFTPGPGQPRSACLCGSAERHVAQLARCGTERREHHV